MKGYLETKSIPKTEALLAKNGLEIDKYDAVVSTVDGYFQQGPLGYRTVFSSLYIDVVDKNVTFDYSSYEKKRYFKMLKAKEISMDEKEWLPLLEEIAISLADELGFKKIEAMGNVKTKDELALKGYKKIERYCYGKAI